MKIELDTKSNIDGNWAKAGTDIRDGDRIQIKDAGQISESTFKNEDGSTKEQYVFKVMTSKKEEFNVAMNRTSRNTLGRGYGTDTEDWVGKVAQAFVVKQMIGTNLRNVLYLAPDGWVMTEDGEFMPKEESQERPTKNQEYPSVHISPDDIPF